MKPNATVTVRRLSATETTRLLDWRRMPKTGACFWANADDMLIGWGEAARFTSSGPDRIDEAAHWWSATCDALDASRWRIGPVAFGALGFDSGDHAVLTVPMTTLRIHNGVAHLVQIGRLGLPPIGEQLEVPAVSSIDPGEIDEAQHIRNVTMALEEISRETVRKVVLSRDVRVSFARALDERHLLRRLRARYPSCTTFAFEGLVGASPERLLRVNDAHAESIVLGGSAWPTSHGCRPDLGLASATAAYSEFEISAREVLRCMTELGLHPVAAEPTVMRLPNISHYAVTIRGEFPPGSNPPAKSLLALAKLHPTPAVGGNPTGPARELIRSLEGRPRGGYAAPVGWIDCRGDGDWWIALRSGRIDGDTLVITAGGGIVSGSDPDREVLETAAKMEPLLDVFRAEAVVGFD